MNSAVGVELFKLSSARLSSSRFGKPVSASCVAWCVSNACCFLRSVMSRRIAVNQTRSFIATRVIDTSTGTWSSAGPTINSK